MYAQIARIGTSFIDVPNKISVSIFFAGCSLRCKDCQNKELWDPKSGQKTSIATVLEKVNNHPIAESIVFLGGEPTEQSDFLTELCKQITDKEKVLYTGREFEVLPQELLKHLDMIICGPYRSELHVNSWPASSNQRVLVKKGDLWNIQKT